METTKRQVANRYPEELATLITNTLKPYDKGQGLVDWKRVKAEGVEATLTAQSGKDIGAIKTWYANRYRKAFWNKDKPTRSHKHEALVKAPEPEVNRVPARSRLHLNYCPSCGQNLSAIKAALDL